MNIVWYGQSCFKIQGKQVTLICDPYDKSIGLRPPRSSADIVTVSHEHYDHNNVKSVHNHPFVICGPGEYEIKGVCISGIQTYHDKKHGQARGQNTVYVIKMDNIFICHLGDLGHLLSDEQLENIGQIDILLVPVGGIYTIDAQEAAKVCDSIEPKIVIPMHYKIPKLNIKLDAIDGFTKEMGIDKRKVEMKLVIKKKDLPTEETKVVLLQAQG